MTIISKFITSILKDTYWYAEIDDSLAEDSLFGKNKGCNFVKGSCAFLRISSDEFSPAKGIIFEGFGYGILRSRFLYDCPRVESFSNVLCHTKRDGNLFGNDGGNTISFNSRSYISTVGNSCGSVCARCYNVFYIYLKTKCDNNGNLILTYINKDYICKVGDENKKIYPKGGSGYI